MIDPKTGEQIIEIRPQYGPNNVITGYHEIPRVEWVDVPCECEEWKAAKKRLESSGIGEKFRKITFADYPTKGKHPLFETAKRISQSYVNIAADDYFNRLRRKESTKGNGLILCGEPGSGKTTLLFAIGNELLSRKIPVLYFQHREEFDKIQENKFEDNGLFQRLRSFRGVLLWDDLFKTQKRDKGGHRDVNDGEANKSWGIINHRSDFDYPTVFSTEWSPSELMSLDRSIAGRMIDRCKHPTDPQKDRLVWFRLSKAEKEAGLDPMKVFDHRFMRLGGE